MASPLYTAPDADLSALTTALAPKLTFQAAIVPSSVAKIKRATALEATAKSVVLLNTTPVGAPGGVPPAGGGIVTTSDCGVPLPLYIVDKPAWLSDTQNGLLALLAIPHGLTRFVSVLSAIPAMSETRLC